MKNKILNLKIKNFNYNELLKHLFFFSKKKKKNCYICISNVHSSVESVINKKFEIAHNNANFSFSDSRILYFIFKIFRVDRIDYISGWDITDKICKIASKKKSKIGVYGSTTTILQKFKQKMENKYSGLNIDYLYSPPFNKKNNFSNKQKMLINKSKIDILIVSLGCPKQEIWMYNNYKKINSVLIGLGAGLDYVSGIKKKPNDFLQKIGIGWMSRLISEPRRLFWRYFSTNLLFIFLFFLQITGLKKFK